MALRLRGISKTPFWLLILVMQVIPMTGIVAMTMLLSDSSDVTSSSNENKLYYLIGSLGAVSVFVTMVTHCVVSLRISNLAAMLQQDPQVIVGDPLCLLKLSRTPWYGVSEVDTLQLAILQTYNAYSMDHRDASAAGDGRRRDTDLDKLEWRTAVSDDDEVGYDDGRPFDPLEAFLASQKAGASTGAAAPMSATSAASAPTGFHRRTSSNGSNPRSVVSAGGSVLGKFFTPRSHRSPSFPVVRGPQSGVSAAAPSTLSDAQAPMMAASDSAEFQSFPTSVDEKSSLFSKSTHNTPRFATPASYGSPATVGSVHHTNSVNGNSSDSFVSQRETASVAMGVSGALRSCDPNDDNSHPQWELLSKGLKLQSSIFVQLLSSIRVGQSLSSVTLPVHILESRSLLEMLSDMFVNWELLMPIAMGTLKENPEERIVEVFRWFISAFHNKPRGAKKPYNSILGEVFQAKFPSFTSRPQSKSRIADTFPPRNTTTKEKSLIYLAEQVSHHPPISAFFAQYGDLLEARGVYMPKGKMVSLNCAASIGDGSFVLSFPKAGYKYRITFPTAYVSGIVAGTPQLELGGMVTISDLAESTCTASVEFLRKGWLSGTYDQIHCKVRKGPTDNDAVVQEFVGTWHDKIYRKGPNGKLGQLFFDPVAFESDIGGSHRPLAVDCKGHPKQSRYVWRELTPTLRSGNAVAATAAKTAVEVAQRQERKTLAQENREHETTFFKFTRGAAVKDATDEERCDEENWEFVGLEQVAQY